MAYRDDILALSPVAYWRLGESSGTTAGDETANNIDGTYTGGITLGATGLLTGDANTCVAGNGSTSYVDLGNASALEITGDLTLVAWLKTTSTATKVLFGCYNPSGGSGYGLAIGVNAAGKPDFYDGSEWNACGTVVNDGAAHMLAAVYTAAGGGSLQWYVDGVAAGSVSSVGALSAYTGNKALLANGSGGSFNWLSNADELAAFSAALSSGQIGSLYTSGTGGGTPNNYTLTADAGSFTLTGQTASLKAARKVTAASGSFTLTGQSASLIAARKVAAGTGSFALAGIAATLKAARKIAAATGSFILTGNDATLSKVGNYTLTAETGSFVLTGQAASLKAARKLTASAGTFAFTGVAATLKAARRIAAAIGSFTLTGKAATLTYTPVAAAAYRAAVLDDSPLLYARLGEASGTTAADETANGLDGTYTGGVTLGQSGLVDDDDTAVLLDGSTGYVDFGNPAALQVTGAWWVEFEYKPTAYPTETNVGLAAHYHDLFSGGFGTESTVPYFVRIRKLAVENVLVLEVGRFSSGTTTVAYWRFTPTDWPTGEKRLISAGYNDTDDQFELWVDNELKATQSDATGAVAGTGSRSIGALNIAGSPARFAHGAFDEVSFYDHRLTSTRIDGHFGASWPVTNVVGTPTLTPTVPESGTYIALGESEDLTGVVVGDFTATADGEALTLTSAYQYGYEWRLKPSRLIVDGEVLTLTYTGTSAVDADATPLATFSGSSVSNGSAVPQETSDHIARGFGVMVDLATPTFIGAQIGDGTENVSVWSPSSLSVSQWLTPIFQSGANYALLIAKHHDGLANWDSASQSHNITASPYAADLVGQFTTAVRALSKPVGLYLSVADYKWEIDNPSGTDEERQTFVEAQIAELLSDYGAISVLWLDAFSSDTSLDFGAIYDLAKSLQPSCVVILNGHALDLTHGDIAIREPGPTDSWDQLPSASNAVPTSVVETIHDDELTWFYDPAETDYKTAVFVNERRSLLNSRWSNYLLAVTPTSDGVLPTEQVLLLQEIGGVAPSLTITRSAATITTTDPVGTVSVGAETVLTYSLENTGTADTSNLTASLTGATGEATVTTAPSDIAAGGAGSFAITLETDAAAPIEFVVTLSDDSGTLAEWTVTASVVNIPTQADIGWTAPNRRLEWTAPNRRLEWTAT